MSKSPFVYDFFKLKANFTVDMCVKTLSVLVWYNLTIYIVVDEFHVSTVADLWEG